MSGLKGQVAVVTGASSGIGRAIARALSAQEVTLCLPGRRPARLDQLLKDLPGVGPGSHSYRLDLTSGNGVAGFAAWLEQTYPRLDILVHCAGIIGQGTVEETSDEDFDQQFATNVRAPFLLTRALIGRLRAQRGQVVFINSKVGLAAKRGVAAYAASKHALRSLADSLRAEENRHGVRVLSVYPGRTAGPLQEQVHQAEGRVYDSERLMRPEDTAELVLAALCLPRTAEVTDISMRPFVPPK
jgi:NAD(P)-dependent dehydrogenase (short-subunit alcohol dehydrogenase family)